MVRTRNILNKNCQDWAFISAQTLDEKKEIYAAVVKFHLDRQKDKVGTSIFDTSTNIQFFGNLLANDELPWRIDMSGIKVEGKFITASISIIEGDIFYYWIPSFDASFAKGSIGGFHLMLLIEACFNSNIKRFDFMGGNEAYKLKWSNGIYSNYKIVAYRSLVPKLQADLKGFTVGFLRRYKDIPALKSLWVTVSKFIGK
jgi:CelD/BcsL family acetyltransferase involved in cellulose biosynthesis